MEKVASTYVHYHVQNGQLCNTGSPVWHSDDLAQWDGWWGEAQEGGGKCAVAADSRCCAAEAYTAL